MADPQIVNWITLAAKKYGADPAAMLATSLVENGARMGLTPGDNGSSFGYYQMHQGGALGSHPPQWATTSAVADNRAREFARLGVHGGKGAAAIQRPADPTGYAAKVQARLAEARRLLAESAGLPSGPQRAAPKTTTQMVAAQSIDRTVAGILGAKSPTAALAQFEAGKQLPMQLEATAPTSAAPATGAFGKVTAGAAAHKIIGMPYQGTHNLGNWESDNAIDIALPSGTPLYAPSDGVIGSQIGSLGASSGSRFAGLRVHLNTGSNELYYAHLSRLAVKAGQSVKAGQLIGYSGSANGVNHLHLGVKSGSPMVYA